MPAEWRWVVLVGSALILTAFAPFIYIVLSGATGTQWQFMGVLHDYPNGATYLSEIMQGNQGAWLVHFQHTPEPHKAMFLDGVYPFLGQITRLIAVSPVFIYHIARLGITLVMYLAIYQLAASIWMRVRTRRLFFLLVSFGAGFGWLAALLTGKTTFPDLVAPEMFPFQSSLVSIHVPLGIACLTLLASIIITMFRPGAQEEPDMNNGGPIAAVLGLVLVLVYPEAFVVFAITLVAYVVAFCVIQRKIALWAVRWLLLIVLPALPVLTIQIAFLSYNPVMGEWSRQNVTPAPSPLALIVGLGVPLLLALPGIRRALRRFEPDGDQFMLIWLLVMLVALYLPGNFQRRFAGGLIIPVVYFSARSLEDFWFRFVNRRWRYRVFTIAIPILFLSHLMVLFAPVVSLFEGSSGEPSGVFLQPDYIAAFRWLDGQTRATDVVLTAPDVGTWLPAWMEARVVYGHPAETMNAAEKKQAVLDWYATDDPESCAALLEGEYAFRTNYRVRYVMVGPQERALGSAACADQLELIASFGGVDIYRQPASESALPPE
jgi:hypothetical protein